MQKFISIEDIRRMAATLYRVTGAPYYFDAPMIGIASAGDPWFEKFKTVIGEHHWTPDEALHFIHPDVKAKSVIVWILPVNERIRKSNQTQKNGMPSEEWASMRSFGEGCNENMRKQFCRLLEENGYSAVAPHLEQVRQGFNIFGMGFTSHWSERHIAFTAGLGTFGLSAGLITERGIAMRIGSVVTDLELVPTARPYGDDPFAWCTRCGACMRRCPAHAIGTHQEDRDKKKCCDHIVNQVSADRANTYGWMDAGLGCGLCQTNVPCEFQRPSK